MEFQPQQLLYFIGLGVLFSIAYFVPSRMLWAKIAIIILIAIAFFINPFREYSLLT